MVESVGNRDLNVTFEPARGRQTTDNSFGAVLERGAERVAKVAVSGVRVLAPALPGGAFLTAVADTAAAVGAGESLAGGDKWALLRAQEQLQDEGLNNSLRLLGLQRKMQEETEAVNIVSNVMKSRHEMAKAAINNIR